MAVEEGGEVDANEQQHLEHEGNWSIDDKVDLISCLKASNMSHCFWISSAIRSGDLGIPLVSLTALSTSRLISESTADIGVAGPVVSCFSGAAEGREGGAVAGGDTWEDDDEEVETVASLANDS